MPFRRWVSETTQLVVGRLEELRVLLQQLAADWNGPRPTLLAAGFETAQLIDRRSKVVQLNGNPECMRRQTLLLPLSAPQKPNSKITVCPSLSRSWA